MKVTWEFLLPSLIYSIQYNKSSKSHHYLGERRQKSNRVRFELKLEQIKLAGGSCSQTSSPNYYHNIFKHLCHVILQTWQSAESPCLVVPLLVLWRNEIKLTNNYLQVPVDIRYSNISSHFQSDFQSLGRNVSTNKYFSIECLLNHQAWGNWSKHPFLPIA